MLLVMFGENHPDPNLTYAADLVQAEWHSILSYDNNDDEENDIGV